MTSQYEYYRLHNVVTTFENLSGEADLASLASDRAEFFTDKLKLPPRLFRDATVLEFGPASGEHSLVFARWGSRLTLVEPNEPAFRQVESYFDAYNLRDSIDAMVAVDLTDFVSERRYDVIVAEGFIYTIQPTQRWLRIFERLSAPHGFFIVSYYERYGALVELAQRGLFHAAARLTDIPRGELARRLFGVKWDAVPHKRSIEAWTIDVLENPTVRAANHIAAGDLLREANACGFEHYASWPHYDDVLATYWHKKKLPPEDRLAEAQVHLARSALSFATGAKVYIASSNQSEIDEIKHTLESLIKEVDALVDASDAGALARCAAGFSRLESVASQMPLVAQSDTVRRGALRLLRSLGRAFDLLSHGDVAGLEAFTSSDQDFIRGWGQPNHFAVFYKT